MRIVLVGIDDPIGRLPEVLHRDGVEVILFSPVGGYLAGSAFVDEYWELPLEQGDATWFDAVIRNGERIAALNADVYVLGSDRLARVIADSKLADEVKLRLLPLKNIKALPMIGSKVGFEQVLRDAEVAAPRTEIVYSREEWSRASARWSIPYVIKGDIGGGGSSVHIVESSAWEAPVEWYPIVAQEYISGTVVAVEAMFVAGRLAGWLYSIPTASATKNGPSVVRKFSAPTHTDFVQTLEKLGRYAVLNGLFNCSFIFNTEKKIHELFEVDPRPNTWFQFGPQLGVDWAELLREKSRFSPPQLTKSSTVIHLYPRELTAAIRYRNFRMLGAWLMRRPGTWNTRMTGDRRVNKRERAQVLAEVKIVLVDYAKSLRAALRPTAPRAMDDQKVTAQKMPPTA